MLQNFENLNSQNSECLYNVDYCPYQLSLLHQTVPCSEETTAHTSFQDSLPTSQIHFSFTHDDNTDVST